MRKEIKWLKGIILNRSGPLSIAQDCNQLELVIKKDNGPCCDGREATVEVQLYSRKRNTVIRLTTTGISQDLLGIRNYA
jgi:hypothetical protein